MLWPKAWASPFPIDTAQAVASQIIAKGYFSHPFMGITYQPITPAIARAYNLSVQWGVYVSRVAANSPAAEAGLQRGDIITSVGGTLLDETHSYLNTLYAYQPGRHSHAEAWCAATRRLNCRSPWESQAASRAIRSHHECEPRTT